LPPPELPHAVAEDAVRRYNAATTTRLVGHSRLPHGNEWRGDVAVRNGVVVVAGRVEGTLLVINGDAILDSSAVVTGDVIVVGGTVARSPTAVISGDLRVYTAPLAYRTKGEEIALAPPDLRPLVPAAGDREVVGHRRLAVVAHAHDGRHVQPGRRPPGGVRAAVRLEAPSQSAPAGRRVGGVPHRRRLHPQRSDLGYLVRTELRSGEAPAYGIELRAFDDVTPVEDWGLRAGEVGWSAFLFQRDYRDYYLSKVSRAASSCNPSARCASTSTCGTTSKPPSARAIRGPCSANDQRWRPKPADRRRALHDARRHAHVRHPQRSARPHRGLVPERPLRKLALEGRDTQTGVPAAVRAPIPTDGSYAFSRVFLDFRRYTRVSPSGRMNLRLFAGGWIGGDPLPLQQRLSTGGPDPLTGYGFRHSACNSDIIDPAFAGTQVAACDRVILAQAEYRGHLQKR